MVATVAQPPLNITAGAGANCPSCGFDLPPAASPDSHSKDLAAAQGLIAELEREVRILNDKAAMAINRCAEYEVALARLKTQASVTSSPQSPPRRQNPATAAAQSPTSSPSYLQQSTERISALLYSRRPTPNAPPALQATTGSPVSASGSRLQQALSPTATQHLGSPTPSTPIHMTEDLLEALTREQSLRQEAEGRLTATSKEMEELSAALFEQANEMVADERRARAKLEERVGELEKRDAEKKKRLDKLESAMQRIERVKNLLRGDAAD